MEVAHAAGDGITGNILDNEVSVKTNESGLKKARDLFVRQQFTETKQTI